MGHLNGHADPTPKDLPDQISLSSLMGPCSVQLISHSTHRNVDRNGMDLCGCSRPHGSATAVPVLCVRSVKKTAPSSNRDGCALCSGHALALLHRPMNLYQMSQCLL